MADLRVRTSKPANPAPFEKASRDLDKEVEKTARTVPPAYTSLALYFTCGGKTVKANGDSAVYHFATSYEKGKEFYESGQAPNYEYANGVRKKLVDSLNRHPEVQAIVRQIWSRFADGAFSASEANQLTRTALEPLLAYREELPASVLDELHEKDHRPSSLLTFPRALNTLVKDAKDRPVELEAKVHKHFKAYLDQTKSRSKAQKDLYEKHKREIGRHVWEMKVYSRLDPQTAMKVAMTRDVENIAMKRPYLEKNKNSELIGCEGSLMARKDDSLAKNARLAGNQVCLAMRAAVKVGATVVQPLILSVPAPALDTQLQAEWSEYVHEKGPKTGKLNRGRYEKSMSSIAEHILACARDNPGHRVVLSGFGLANFIKGLPPEEQEIARQVGRDVMVQLMADLKKENIDFAYMAGRQDDAPWNKIDPKPHYLGKFPDKKDTTSWLQSTDIIVNAWDPHSLVGNGNKDDDSLDGRVGRISLVHEQNALGCNIYHALAAEAADRKQAANADVSANASNTNSHGATTAARGVTFGQIFDQMAGLSAPTDPKAMTTLTAVLGNPATASSTGITTTTAVATTTTTTTSLSSLVQDDKLV